MKPILLRTICTIFSFLSAAGFRAFGGDLNPPVGPVVPTMKTLTEVEPRIAVNATNTPGDAGAVFKITVDGSYYLSGDLIGEAGKVGIQIDASAVTLGLGGFVVQGVPGALDGVRGNPVDQHTLSISNGTFRDWPGSAIDVGIARNSLIREIRTIASGVNGIKIGNNSVVERCTAAASSSIGIQAGINSRIVNCCTNAGSVGYSVGVRSSLMGCTAQGASGNGIETGSNASVIGCTSSSNGAGIVTSGQSSVLDCVANSNSGNGIIIGYAAIVRGCEASLNSGAGIAAAGNAVHITSCSTSANSGNGIEVANNSLVANNNGDFNGTGILVTGIENRIDSNAFTDCIGDGLRVTGTNNLVVRNSAGGNAVNYSIAAGNKDAEILAPGAAFVATNPWANFSY